MSEELSLAEVLNKWAADGGDLRGMLPPGRDRSIETASEARALCAALDACRAEPARAAKVSILSPFHSLVGFFQQVSSQEAFDVLKAEGLPRLRAWVRDLLAGAGGEADDVMFILKILAMYKQREDVGLIAEAARKPIKPDGYMWSIVLRPFDAKHPHALDMVDALRDPLPSGFLLVAYLDMVNALAVGGILERHPFDSGPGRRQLDAWLRDTNEDAFSYAHGATAALPFIDQAARERLLTVAGEHPDPSVRMEAAWAQAKCGDGTGLERLAQACLDPRYSLAAQGYLNELGASGQIPQETQQMGLKAVAEMASWLGHPNEYGRPPDAIELFDARELYWPPTNDRRHVALVSYAYNDDEGGEPEHGVGMVGSVTFSLSGEAMAGMLAEDIYGVHCAWELAIGHDARAPKERTAKAGRAILAQHNAGF